MAPTASTIPIRPAELNGLWGSQGDGTFVNPIVPADFSDIDAIQVGPDYVAISSTLHGSPGMAILRSSDLVNWRMIGHAIADVAALEGWSLSARPGWLRLRSFPPVRSDFTGISNVLSQRAWRTAHNEVRVCLQYDGMVRGQRAGLCHMSREFASIEVESDVGGQRLIVRMGEAPAATLDLPSASKGQIWLSSSWSDEGIASFACSADGEAFAPAGESFQLKWGHYRGDRVGLFTCGTASAGEGFADFSRFTYAVANPERPAGRGS